MADSDSDTVLFNTNRNNNTEEEEVEEGTVGRLPSDLVTRDSIHSGTDEDDDGRDKPVPMRRSTSGGENIQPEVDRRQQHTRGEEGTVRRLPSDFVMRDGSPSGTDEDDDVRDRSMPMGSTRKKRSTSAADHIRREVDQRQRHTRSETRDTFNDRRDMNRNNMMSPIRYRSPPRHYRQRLKTMAAWKQ